MSAYPVWAGDVDVTPLRAAEIPVTSSSVLSVPAPDWRLYDDVEIATLPDPEWLIPDLLPKSSLGFIVGQPGTGKTTLSIQLAVALATKRNFFGYRVSEQCSSIVVPFEDVSGSKVRLLAAKRAANVSPGRPIGVYTLPHAHINLMEAGDVLRLQRFLARQIEVTPPPHPLGVVILDTWAAGTPGANENAAEDMTLALTNCQRHLRDALGVTVICLHHTNAAGTRERGHSALNGGAEFTFILEQADDVVTVECKKQKNSEKFPSFTLKLVPLEGTSSVVFRTASDVLPSGTLSPIQAKVLDVLIHAPTDGLTSGAWQSGCQGVNPRSFFRATKHLEDCGYIRKNGSHYHATQRRPE